MKRHLFNVLAGVSMVLCVAIVFLWITSYRRAANLGYYASQDTNGLYRDYSLFSNKGRMGFSLSSQDEPGLEERGRLVLFLPQLRPYWPHPWVSWLWSSTNTVTKGMAFGGFYCEWHPRLRDWWCDVDVPYWFLLLLCSVPPMRLVLKRQTAAGYCLQCGYDLRATPERCPECGAVPEKVEAKE